MQDLLQKQIQIVSTHSRLKAAGLQYLEGTNVIFVSTHSRLKAAGRADAAEVQGLRGFNTQPPEGGWTTPCVDIHNKKRFQHTAA